MLGGSRERDLLEGRCPGCDRLWRCSTGQAMKTVVEFEAKEGRTQDVEGRTAGVGVESAIEMMRPAFAKATAGEVSADRDEGGAEKVAKKFNKPIGIIIAVDPEAGIVEGYSWGTKLTARGTRKEGCEVADEMLREAIGAINRMMIGGGE